MTRVVCPSCLCLFTVHAIHGALVDCLCGASWSVRADIAGYSLRPPRPLIVDASTIQLAMEHLR